MTDVYIVENHLGGLYLTTCCREDIEQPCPQCGDWDTVLDRFEKGDAKSARRALSSVFVDSWLECPLCDFLLGDPEEVAEIKRKLDEGCTAAELRRFFIHIDENSALLPAGLMDDLDALAQEIRNQAEDCIEERAGQATQVAARTEEGA